MGPVKIIVQKRLKMIGKKHHNNNNKINITTEALTRKKLTKLNRKRKRLSLHD